MSGWSTDLRHAIAALRRRPRFALVAAGTLALGVAASTVTFSVVHAVLLRPLPWSDAGRLVAVWPEVNFNASMVERVRDGVPALDGVSGISLWSLTLTHDGGEPVELQAALVSPGHFELLGVRPILGRAFTREEARPENAGVVILSHALWANRYHSDPAVLGRSLELGGADHDRRTVIGVLPPGFQPVRGPVDVWVPLERDPAVGFAADRTWYVNTRVGRLAPGVALEQAQAQLRVVAAALHEEAPEQIDADEVRSASVVPLLDAVAGPAAPALGLLSVAVGLVLLIACADVAHLLLARGEGRARELAVRLALGASRGRVVRQLLLEGALLGLAGWALGVGLAVPLLRALLADMPADIPRGGDARLDAAALGFALAASLSAAALSAALPALRGSGVPARTALRAAGRLVAGRRSAARGLVVAEVALCVVLVTAAGLMLRTLASLADVDPGFRADGVLAVRPSPPAADYAGPDAARAYYGRALERLRGLPAVASAGGIQLLPLDGGNWRFPIFAEGRDVPEGTPPPSANFRLTTPGHLAALRIPLRRGRDFSERDVPEAPPVALVNEAFAARFWPGQDPIGRQVRVLERGALPRTVVGVVGDVRQHALERASAEEIYVPAAQWPWASSLWLLIRARDGDAPALAPAVRAALWSVDPDVPLAGMEPLAAVVDRSLGQRRFAARLLGLFAALALLLAVCGVYAVTAYGVARRTPELGLRVALGATPGRVLLSTLLDGAGPVVVGLVLGMAGALIASHAMRSMLFGVTATDPATFAGVLLLLGAAGCGAGFAPARRASRVDPMVAMREE